MSSATVFHSEAETTAISPSVDEAVSRNLGQELPDSEKQEEKDPLYLDYLRATQKLYQAPLRIPKRCTVDPKYSSRPKVNLEWIITTDLSNPLPIKAEPPQNEELEEVPESDWVIDTREALYDDLQGFDMPPPSRSRQETEDLEWIITTNPNEPVVTRTVEPVRDDKDALASEWIFNTNPDDFPIDQEIDYIESEDSNQEDEVQTADHQRSESTALPDTREIEERLRTAVKFNEDSTAFEQIEVETS